MSLFLSIIFILTFLCVLVLILSYKDKINFDVNNKSNNRYTSNIYALTKTYSSSEKRNKYSSVDDPKILDELIYEPPAGLFDKVDLLQNNEYTQPINPNPTKTPYITITRVDGDKLIKSKRLEIIDLIQDCINNIIKKRNYISVNAIISGNGDDIVVKTLTKTYASELPRSETSHVSVLAYLHTLIRIVYHDKRELTSIEIVDIKKIKSAYEYKKNNRRPYGSVGESWR